MNVFKALFFIAFFCGAFCSCKVTGQVSQKAVDAFLNDTAVRTGHAGISIYDPAAKKYVYNYNADKNFLPSSNVKLFTLYAGMKYLGDSLPGLKYISDSTSMEIYSTGDPTFLHPDFKDQRIFEFLKSSKRILKIISGFETTAYGAGWSWDDYPEDFMAERSAFPIYGNVVTFTAKQQLVPNQKLFHIKQRFDDFGEHSIRRKRNNPQRNFLWNDFHPQLENKANLLKIPFLTSDKTFAELLKDTTHLIISDGDSAMFLESLPEHTIFSRPVDSLFRPMMFNSDNFFAEQTLLMVSNEKLGYMSDEQIIDTLLKTDFKDLPTKPRWVDGSGLSRYDLFSPKDFIYILNKLQSEFGFARMKRILPTAGQGTLTNYYEGDAGFIYAKTGSMSNNVSLSGYLITKKNKLLLFSLIINNFDGSGKSGRRAIERLIKSIRETN